MQIWCKWHMKAEYTDAAEFQFFHSKQKWCRGYYSCLKQQCLHQNSFLYTAETACCFFCRIIKPTSSSIHQIAYRFFLLSQLSPGPRTNTQRHKKTDVKSFSIDAAFSTQKLASQPYNLWCYHNYNTLFQVLFFRIKR